MAFTDPVMFMGLALIVGVSQLLVAINKMDTVDWSEDRYCEILKKLGSFLKQAGFRDSELSYVPCSGLNGENLTRPPTEPQLAAWYKGPTLTQQIGEHSWLKYTSWVF